MIADFIESALIIDDKPDEVEGLINILEEKGIAVTFYEPDNIKGSAELKNRKVIFLDLYLDPTITELKGNISKIRAILQAKIGKRFGSYGIVLWSAHHDEIEELKQKINTDRSLYTPPLFIVGLNKTAYTHSNDFSSLFSDINDILTTNPAATFFLEWSNSVQQAQYKTISDIYSLTPDYINQTEDLTYILRELAKNHTGIPDDQLADYPLHIDAFKAFDDLLHAELTNNQTDGVNIFSGEVNFSRVDLLYSIYAQLNAAVCLDSNNINQRVPIPGNVYECVDLGNDYLKIKDAPKKAKKVIIEMTPPCDFAQKKNGHPRVIAGFIIECPDTKEKREDYATKTFKSDARYNLWPIMIDGFAKPQFVCFDFRYATSLNVEELKDETKYKILFRAKPKLFADIMQKFSSHAARLGLSVIHD